MPADRPWTDAEHDAVCRALDGRLRDQPGVPMSVSLMYAADAVLDAAAPLIAARARAQVAEEIRAHANKHAPVTGNRAQKRMRRHLLIAERLADPPRVLTDGFARAHATTEGTDHDH